MTKRPYRRQSAESDPSAFTLPLVLGNLFQQFYALADTIIVGRFWRRQCAGVGRLHRLHQLPDPWASSLASAMVLPSPSLSCSAHGISDLRRHVANAAWLCIAFSVVLYHHHGDPDPPAAGKRCRRLRTSWTARSSILAGSFASIPFIFFVQHGRQHHARPGRQQTPLYFLDPDQRSEHRPGSLFIVPFKMGILGAALATDISQAISGVVFGFLCRKFEVLHMQKGELASASAPASA